MKGILEHYGFDVKKEYPLQSGERIDVVGWCNRELPWKGKSVAIEVEKTSPLEKDIDKLRRSKFDLKFVIRFVANDLLASVGGILVIYPPERFENFLRLMLNVPPTYPIYHGLAEAPIHKPIPQQLAELLESIGLGEFAPKVEDALLKLYLSYPHGLPLRVGRQKTGGIEFADVSDIEPQVRSILSGLGLAREEMIGGAYETGKVWGFYLTNKGLKYGRDILTSKLKKRETFLSSLLKDFNPKLVFAACVGFGPYIETKSRYEEIARVEGKDPHLSLLEWALFEFEEPSLIEGYRRDLATKFHISDPLRLYAKYLANLPTVRRTILSYYERLLDMGLAARIKLYTTKGKYFGDAISTSLEVVETILKQMFEDGLPSSEEVKALNKTALIWHLSKGEYRVGEDKFLALLASHGVTIDELKEELDNLNRIKVTSKYIDKTRERPFIVIDEENFVKNILQRIEEEEIKMV